jgi:hypothetical protein
MQIDEKKISDQTIEALLLNRENLDMLEDILARDEPRILTGCDPEGFSNDGGRFLKNGVVNLILPEIQSKVCEFLGVSENKMPKWRYLSPLEAYWNKSGMLIEEIGLISLGSVMIANGIYTIGHGIVDQIYPDVLGDIINPILWSISGSINIWLGAKNLRYAKNKSRMGVSSIYKSKKDVIRMLKLPESGLIQDLAHEYAHHLQYATLELRGHKRKPAEFIEGHARGVQRFIARDYTISRRDISFWERYKNQTFGELSGAFAWMCERLGEVKRTELLLEKNKQVFLGLDYLDEKTGNTTKHAIGNTFFYLAEKKHGKAIYSDAIHGNFEFIR